MINQLELTKAVELKEFCANNDNNTEAIDSQTQKIKEWLRDYAVRRINSRLIDERRCITPHIVLDFGKQGLLEMIVPKSYGGLGLTYRSMFQIIEQIAAININLATFVGLNNVLGIYPILKYGSEVIKETYLRSLAQGRDLAAFAITEPGAGSNPRAMQTQAIPDEKGGWFLSGDKIWIGSASWASVINVFAYVLDETGKSLGVTAFAIPENATGLQQGAEALTMGMRGMVQNAIHLKQVSVNPEQVLGNLGEGFNIAQDAMQLGRLGIATICLGGMKRCAQLMLRYSRRRSVAFGQLFNKSVTLERVSALINAIRAIECLLTTVTQWLDNAIPVPQEAYLTAKIIAPELMWQAADQLIQLLGGRGYIETNIAPQILRDARLLRIFERPTEALQIYLGTRALYQTSELFKPFHELLDTPEVVAQLQSSIEFCNTQLQSQNSLKSKQALTQQLSQKLGEAAAWSFLLACVQKSCQSEPTEELECTEKWVQQCLRDKLVIVSAVFSSSSTVLSADRLKMIINSYVQAIGDLEQTLPGEETELDSYLRKD